MNLSKMPVKARAKSRIPKEPTPWTFVIYKIDLSIVRFEKSVPENFLLGLQGNSIVLSDYDFSVNSERLIVRSMLCTSMPALETMAVHMVSLLKRNPHYWGNTEKLLEHWKKNMTRTASFYEWEYPVLKEMKIN